MSLTRLPHERKGSLLSGAALVAGTSVGAGMLALPFVTGAAGLVPAILISFASWAFMLCTGLLFLEVTLWSPDGANLLTMTRTFLGKIGRWIGGFFFLLLYYCLLVAYISGGAPILSDLFASWTGIPLSQQVALPLYTLIFATIVFLGPSLTGRVNFILVVGLIISYIIVISLGMPRLQSHLFHGRDWGFGILAAATLFSAYGYHNVVPSIATLLRRDGRTLRRALFLGTFITLVIYSLWQLTIIGVVPRSLLAQTVEQERPIADALGAVAGNHWLPLIVQYFSLFAIVTSFLGVGLSMVDFLGDGIRIPRVGWGRLILSLLAFVPPFLFAWWLPGLFFAALRYAGGLGEATLNGILPVLMVWIGRYKRQLASDWQLPGGRLTLSLLLLVGAWLFIHECISLISQIAAA